MSTFAWLASRWRWCLVTLAVLGASVWSLWLYLRGRAAAQDQAAVDAARDATVTREATERAEEEYRETMADIGVRYAGDSRERLLREAKAIIDAAVDRARRQ